MLIVPTNTDDSHSSPRGNSGAPMMLDKLKIVTRLRLKPEALESPERFADIGGRVAREVSSTENDDSYRKKTGTIENTVGIW